MYTYILCIYIHTYKPWPLQKYHYRNKVFSSYVYFLPYRLWMNYSAIIYNFKIYTLSALRFQNWESTDHISAFLASSL